MTRAEELAEKVRNEYGRWREEALSELVADAEALAGALEREKRAADIESEHLTLQLHAANGKAEALAGALEGIAERSVTVNGTVPLWDAEEANALAREALARYRGEKDDPHGIRRPGEYNHFGGDCI